MSTAVPATVTICMYIYGLLRVTASADQLLSVFSAEEPQWPGVERCSPKLCSPPQGIKGGL